MSIILVNAGTCLLSAGLIWQLPHVPPMPVPQEGKRWVALRDRPYLAVTVLYGVLSMQYEILVLALPLWLADSNHVPRWIISPLLLVNTVLVVLLQVRTSRGVDSIARGAVTTRLAGFAFLLSCTVFAFATSLPTGWSVAAITGGVIVHTLGELYVTAGEFELSFDLAADYAQGQYQGVFGMGQGAFIAFAPLIITTLCIGLGETGWVLLGLIFTAAGVATVPIARWAEDCRPHQPSSVLESKPIN